ncbi:hypothetical protein [Desulfolutivibrio sulfoxidireducens]|uniref:hypothetical protein n=1 Tax=Desulfolutivibrio sulfoxidireducens TaxID=2773299 RepID=UPI00159E2F98|nr:hypothetical protein [Desulfolutivibrio sulfoxidireducens]QLA16822.1 hypothetical protein GD605_12350 [Desulfolutivibrio sulfoxidireducens]QLA20387.1 hypothetical protein GD604_12045 [Desulfolutivibrio sulfoxidireducens]
MPKTPNNPALDASLEKELAGLKAEYDRLRDEKVRAEQDLAHLAAQLDELEKKALAEYGTANPDELAGLLDAKRRENAALVADYREHIRTVRQDLDAIDREFGE